MGALSDRKSPLSTMRSSMSVRKKSAVSENRLLGRSVKPARRKHKLGSKGTRQFPDQYLYEKLGLVRLTERTRDLPWAKA